MVQPALASPSDVLLVSRIPRWFRLVERSLVSWEVGQVVPHIAPTAGVVSPLSTHIVHGFVEPHYEKDGFPVPYWTAVAVPTPLAILDSYSHQQLARMMGIPDDALPGFLQETAGEVEQIRAAIRKDLAPFAGKALQFRIREEEVLYSVRQDQENVTMDWLNTPPDQILRMPPDQDDDEEDDEEEDEGASPPS
jgi:hypothetical protein